MSLEGTVALVTGASSGIGAATAEALAGAGAAVALVARRADRLHELARRIESAGGRTLEITADVTDREQAHAALQRTVTELGRLDILINNAGMMLLGPIVEAPVDEWDQMLAVNVHGLLHCADAALPHLIRAAQQGPRELADMVNVSSVAGRVVRRGSGVYNLTKHGIGAFSESLRQEVADRHVRVALIEPGAVDTELSSHNRPEILDGIEQRFSGVERLLAEDIADAILYIVTRPRRAAINELLIRPAEQAD